MNLLGLSILLTMYSVQVCKCFSVNVTTETDFCGIARNDSYIGCNH